jgi:hypothetical protein
MRVDLLLNDVNYDALPEKLNCRFSLLGGKRIFIIALTQGAQY